MNNSYLFFIFIFITLLVCYNILSRYFYFFEKIHEALVSGFLFFLSIILAVISWFALVNYRIAHFKKNESYEKILSFLEAEHGIKFSPYAKRIRLSEYAPDDGDVLKHGLHACGKPCIANFRDNNINRNFISKINHILQMNPMNNFTGLKTIMLLL